MTNGRAGSASFSDLYGAFNFGPTTAQLQSPATRVGAGTQAVADAAPPTRTPAMIAKAFLDNPVGVLVLVAVALMLFSLSD